MNYTPGTTIFGDWQITREIGEGSFGKVFEIQKTDYGVTMRSALKVIRVPKSQTDIRAALADGMDEKSVTTYFQGFVEEIVKEIAIMSSLKSHPGIVSCEDHKVIDHAGSIGWDILIRMELLQSLTDYQLSHTMNEAAVRQMAIDLTDALAFCQKKALIHRDIKPENIFVSETGHFKLGDFGVARTAEKTTGGLSKKGTETYMAPEVYLGRPYGSTVDIYSLGLVLYKFMNHGRLPFLPAYPAPITFADRENAMAKRMQGVPLPPPAAASPELAAIILKACAYNPEDRYRTAADMLEALQGSAAPQPPVSFAQAPDPAVEAAPLPDEDDAQDQTIGMWNVVSEPASAPEPDTGDDDGTVGMWGSASLAAANETAAPSAPAESTRQDAPSAPKFPEPAPAPRPQQTAKNNKGKLILLGSLAAVVLIIVLIVVLIGGDSEAERTAQSNAASFGNLGDLVNSSDDSEEGESAANESIGSSNSLIEDPVINSLWNTTCDTIAEELTPYYAITATKLISELQSKGYYFLQADKCTFAADPYLFDDGPSFGINTTYANYYYMIAIPDSVYSACGAQPVLDQLPAYVTICSDANGNLHVIEWTWNAAELDNIADTTFIYDLPLSQAGYSFTMSDFFSAYGITQEMLTPVLESDFCHTDTNVYINYDNDNEDFQIFSLLMPEEAWFCLIDLWTLDDETTVSLLYTDDARDMSMPDLSSLSASNGAAAQTTFDLTNEADNQAYWEPILNTYLSDLDTKLSQLLVDFTYSDDGSSEANLEAIRSALKQQKFTSSEVSYYNSSPYISPYHYFVIGSDICMVTVKDYDLTAGQALNREIEFYFDIKTPRLIQFNYSSADFAA